MEDGNYHFSTLRLGRRKSWRKRKFYNQLQELLNKTNKSDYILHSGVLNLRMGNAEIHNILKSLENLLQILAADGSVGK